MNPHVKNFSSPSHLLKVSKLFLKISQFKFLVMTEKNIFVCKTFLSLNISDFSLFFIQKLQPLPLKVTPSFPAAPSKNWDPVKSPPPPHPQNLCLFSSSSLPAIIAHNHLPTFKIFSNFVHFCPIFKYFALFYPFLTFFLPLFALFCPFSEKSQTCPYFLE